MHDLNMLFHYSKKESLIKAIVSEERAAINKRLPLFFK